MTVTDQIKILDKRTMQNEAQYDLDRKAAKISVLSSSNLDKYEYLTGEDLGFFEQAKFVYSPLGKIFSKGLDEDDQKEGLLKRLKNIESKIKREDKEESELIKNEEQSEIVKDESTVVDKNLKKFVLLEDKLDFIYKNIGSNFNSTGKKILIKLAKDEKTIDYNNLFFKLNEAAAVKNVDFLQKFGTFSDLLSFLLNNSMRIITSVEDQTKIFKAITVLRIIISNMKTDIADQSKEEKKKVFAEQKIVLSNAEMLLEQRQELIDQFSKNDIISKGEKFYGAPKRVKKAYQRNQNKSLIIQFLSGFKCQKID